MSAEPLDVATARAALYAGSLKEFTAERKRLADALKQRGDKAAAAEVGKLPRPTMSAWLVNRLWHAARADVDALFAAAARVQAGELAAMAEQRAALARLRARGAELLVEDGHAAGEATLQRAATTLQALAAAGGFAPDPPGQLVADRDPPGFEAMAALAGAAVVKPPPAAAPAAPARTRDDVDAAAVAAADARAEAERAAAAAAAAERARAAERRRRIAELANLERLAEQAAGDLAVRGKTVDELRAALARAEAALAEARARAERATAAAAEARARLDE